MDGWDVAKLVMMVAVAALSGVASAFVAWGKMAANVRHDADRLQGLERKIDGLGSRLGCVEQHLSAMNVNIKWLRGDWERRNGTGG